MFKVLTFCTLLLLVAQVAAGQSVLSAGSWFHFTTQQDGVHRLSFEDLQGYGILNNPVQSNNIGLFSNGPGMLPEENWLPRQNDLLEVAIDVVDGGDAEFGPGDYLLFYGTDQVQWTYDGTSDHFLHQQHLYDDYTHFFLSIDSGEGVRISSGTPLILPITHDTNSFIDRQVHEAENFNLHQSGKKWFGESFDSTSTLEFTFHFSDLVTDQSATCVVDLVSRCYGTGNTNNFTVTLPGMTSSFGVTNIAGNYLLDIVRPANEQFSFFPADDIITLNIDYEPFNDYSAAWINYITLQAERALLASDENQLHFRQTAGLNSGSTSYNIGNFSSEFSIWEITHFHQAVEIDGTPTTDGYTFVAPNNILREFVCFSPNNLLSPTFEGPVANQSLKAQPPADAFIVTHPLFLSQAQQLASFHEVENNLTVNVATTEQIYQEFSGGAKDITAIKDYLRHFFEQAESPAQTPKYLCLLGDASYDYKGNLHPDSDFVPTYESENSYALITSFCSDDYFGLLDFSDSNELTDEIDLAIGRLPARTIEEAQAMVDKIISYHQTENNGSWQYNAVFIADDEDNNLHVSQSNQLATNMENSYCPLHIHKIFFDDFEQVIQGESERYPDATAAIINKLNDGVLIANYTGHSGHSNWASEIVMSDSIFEHLSNTFLPLFFMANCEFSKYDSPGNISGSELMMFNPNGGSIACISNARPGYSSSNYAFNNYFNNQLFLQEDGQFPTLGDVIRNTKNNNISPTGITHRSINLLGDPMMRLNYPDLEVHVTEVSGVEMAGDDYLFNYGAEIAFSGEIIDNSGALQNAFNGALEYLILDSKIPEITLGNDNVTPFEYAIRKDTVASGMTNVINGIFTFNALIENNGNDYTGNGKMLLFAANEEQSATGCFTPFKVLQSPVNIEETLSMEAVFYPNPVQEQLRIAVSVVNQPIHIEIFDSDGKRLQQSHESTPHEIVIPMAHLKAGEYIIRLRTETKHAVAKIVKVR